MRNGIVVAAFVLGACSNPNSLDSEVLDFRAESIDVAVPIIEDSLGMVEAVGSDGTIEIRGAVLLPCSGPAPFGQLSRFREILRLEIGFERQVICATMESGWGWEATLSDLRAGTYTVIVQQPIPNASHTDYPVTRVFEGSIVVH